MNGKILVITEKIKGGEWIAINRLTLALKNKHPHLSFHYAVLDRRLYSQRHFGFILDNIKYYLYARKEIKKIINNNVFDYVFLSDYLWALATIGVKQKNTKLIFMFHGLRSLPFRKLSDFDYKQMFIKLLERLSWIFSDAIITPSKFAYNYVFRNINFFIKNSKLFLVKNIVSDRFFVKHLIKHEDNNFNILYSGRLVKQKGLENLILSFSRIILKIPSARLWIAFPNSSIDIETRQKVKSLIKENNLISKIKFFRDLSESKLSLLYSKASVLVLPSEFEMAPMSVLESMASGTPVIATSVGNIRELLTRIDKNIILKDNSIDEIYKKLMMFYAYKKSKKESLGKMSRQIANNFTDKKAVDDFNKVFKFLDFK